MCRRVLWFRLCWCVSVVRWILGFNRTLIPCKAACLWNHHIQYTEYHLMICIADTLILLHSTVHPRAVLTDLRFRSHVRLSLYAGWRSLGQDSWNKLCISSEHLLSDCTSSLLKSPSPFQRNNKSHSYSTLEAQRRCTDPFIVDTHVHTHTHTRTHTN